MLAKSNDERGQATIEFALALPLLVVFVMLIAQFAIVARQQLALWEVARDAARLASVSPNPQTAAQEIVAQNGFSTSAVVATNSDGITQVSLTFKENTSLPLLGPFIPSITLRAHVAMLTEP
ncbi:MAG: TadE family protein [Actinomycetes bacterium]|jgi:Flp pilus assembly protein TadG